MGALYLRYTSEGERLRSRRIGLGMSVSRVAKLTFLSRQAIYNVENGAGSKVITNYLNLFYKDFEEKLGNSQNK